MNGHLMSYRLNLGICVFHVFMLFYVLATGDVPWVQTAALGFNGGLAFLGKTMHNKSQAKSLAAPAPTPELTAEMCSLWEIRRTELKMLDAGVITDLEVSVCENTDCPECQVTRRTQRWARQAEEKQKSIEASAHYAKQRREFFEYRDKHPRPPKGSAGIGNANNDTKCFYCGALSTQSTCNPCRMSNMAKKNGTARRKYQATLNTSIGKITVEIPPSVPRFATPVETFSRGGERMKVKWLWSYDGSKTYDFVSFYERIVNWTEFGGDGTEVKHTSWVLVNEGEGQKAINSGSATANEIRADGNVIVTERWRDVDGQAIKVPDEVPDNAHASIGYDPTMMTDLVFWKWTDKKSGRTVGRRQYISSISEPGYIARNRRENVVDTNWMMT